MAARQAVFLRNVGFGAAQNTGTSLASPRAVPTRRSTNPPGKTSFLHHPLIVTAVVALCGSVAPLAPLPALVVAVVWTGAALGLSGRTTTKGKGRYFPPFLFVVFLLCGTRSTSALEDYERKHFATVAELGGPRRCSGTATVITSPTLRTSADDGQVVPIFTAESQNIDCEGRSLSGTQVIRLYGGPTDLARDDRVEFIAQLAPQRLFRNAGLPSPWLSAARRRATLSGSIVFAERVGSASTLSGFVDRKRTQIRSRILATYSPLSAPLGRALVLGENDLNIEDAEAFRDSGLLHLLAVSGTHLVIAVLALVEAFGAVLVRIGPLARRYDMRRFSSALGVVLSLLYADFSGGSGSAWRAAFMLCLVCGGRSLGLKVGGGAALGASLLVGLATDPLLGSDYSFLLSALATSGLIGLGQPLSAWADRGVFAKMPLRPLALSFIATVSSTIPCAPVLAMMDGDMTWAALFANVVAGPMGELIALPACLLHTLCEGVPPLERGLGLVGSGALHWVRSVALWSASVQMAQFSVPFPNPWDVALLVCGLGFAPRLAALIIPLFRIHPLWLLPALAATVSGFVLNDPNGDEYERPLSVTALDVGQGDALLVEFPDGKNALIDGGGFATGLPDTGTRVVLPLLRARNIERLDLLVLSHPHPDHMMGLVSVSAELDVGEVWIPGVSPQRQGPLRTILENAKKHGATVRTAADLCGQRSWGGTRLRILAPCTDEVRRLDANNASFVLWIGHGERSALLTGDIEKEGEADLLAHRRQDLQADLLKVAHHGSDTSSTPPFLDAVRPSVAFISSGVRNRYEHPRPSTLRNLESRNIFTLRTDQWGSLTWHTDGQNQWTSACDSAIVSPWTKAKQTAPTAFTPATSEPSPN